MNIDKSRWQRVKFGDVVWLNTDRCADPAAAGIERYVGLEHIDPEDLRIRRWGWVEDGTTFTNRFRQGQVLFGKRRAYQRKVAVADFQGVCSGDIYVLEQKETRLLADILPFLCQTDAFYEHAVGTSAGSLSPRTNWSQLADFHFYLPTLYEQQQIVDALSAIDDCINEYLQLREALNTLLVSHSENLVQRWYAQDCSQPVDELLAESPRNGYSPPTSATVQEFKTVSISAVSNGIFEPNGNIKYANVHVDQIRRFLVQQDDMFVVRGNGNKKLTGKSGIACATYADLFYPDLLIRLRFNPAKILPSFAAAIWNSPSVHESLISRAKSTNGIWKINGHDIRQHYLITPPLEIQGQFIAETKRIQELIAASNRRLATLHRIRSHVLNEYLSAPTNDI